jgi:hypothetical protein
MIIKSIRIDTLPEEKPECPHCKSKNTEYSDGQEYDEKHMVWDYECGDCYKWFGFIFPKDDLR